MSNRLPLGAVPALISGYRGVSLLTSSRKLLILGRAEAFFLDISCHRLI